MNKLLTLAIGICLAAGVRGTAQQMDEPRMDDRRPPRGEDRPARMEPLTDAQKEQVKAILSRFDAAALTAETARAIHEAFRQAGLHAGPAMEDTLRESGFDPEQLRQLAPPPRQRDRRSHEARRGEARPDAQDEARPQAGGERRAPGSRKPRGQGRYSLEQAVSDRAQLHTIAFSGLAFITGNFGASTFLPPGKVCDFFGFQYMRDIDAAGKGHNPMFLNRVAGNVLHILTDPQRKLFEDLATEQAGLFEQLALRRFPLIKAFHRELDNDIPKDSAGLDREEVARYVGDLFTLDAELSFRRAEVFGKVAASLTADQKEYLGKMKFGDSSTWPDLDERDALKRPTPGTPRFFNVAYMTYASEFFSWYAGSVEADTYFCPERHGTYFGGFYMKDMPAMGKRDYDISTSRTGDSGEAFLALLEGGQRAEITAIVEAQRKPLAEIIEVRRAMAAELRGFLNGKPPDEARVTALGRRYGELDGEISWLYATAFARVNQTLTGEQKAAMLKLRDLDGHRCAPAYLYSQPMQTAPGLPDTEFLFSK